MSDSEDFESAESADEEVKNEKSSKEVSTVVSSSDSQTEMAKMSSNSSSWRSWSAFEMISSASKSVASVTTKMTQSLSTAIDAINIPEPEEMAKLRADQKPIEETSAVYNESPKMVEHQIEEEGRVFKLDSLLSNVGMISSKVVNGSLNTFEEIGKKTMNILQDTDPNIKSKLRGINSNRPNLSELLNEAKNSDTCNEAEEVTKKIPLVSFEHVLEEKSGIVSVEALELLSKQSKMKIDLLLKPLGGKMLMEMEETLKEVQELCELPDSDSVNDEITTHTLSQHFSKAIEDLDITFNFSDIICYSCESEKWIRESKEDENDSTLIYNKSIESLATLCSLSLKNYHKMAELMLSLSHRSTADEVDAIIQLTTVYFNLFNYVATLFSEKIGNCKIDDGNNKKMSMDVFIECSNAVTYVKKAFNYFIPILQIGAL